MIFAFLIPKVISIHAPRTGSDGSTFPKSADLSYFNPRSPHGERLICIGVNSEKLSISIHAPRTGSDVITCKRFNSYIISIHAPRTGSDHAQASSGCKHLRFQSTLPARGATSLRFPSRKGSPKFQSTLPARGATQQRQHLLLHLHWISIHAPRTGSDTIAYKMAEQETQISIHAPRTGSDEIVLHSVKQPKEISIHAPRTGSDHQVQLAIRRHHLISIHAPRTGSDPAEPAERASRQQFQSTLPARGATTRSGWRTNTGS